MELKDYIKKFDFTHLKKVIKEIDNGGYLSLNPKLIFNNEKQESVFIKSEDIFTITVLKRLVNDHDRLLEILTSDVKSKSESLINYISKLSKDINEDILIGLGYCHSHGYDNGYLDGYKIGYSKAKEELNNG